ncbi:hypothetical protein ACFX2C_038310 [Malus domestica]
MSSASTPDHSGINGNIYCSCACSSFTCDPRNPITRTLKFCKVRVPIHGRVQDLIGRLTLQKKIGLLVSNAIVVPRLGIQGYEWWSEALHGVSNVRPRTKFARSSSTAAAASRPMTLYILRPTPGRAFHGLLPLMPLQTPCCVGTFNNLFFLFNFSKALLEQQLDQQRCQWISVGPTSFSLVEAVKQIEKPHFKVK